MPGKPVRLLAEEEKAETAAAKPSAQAMIKNAKASNTLVIGSRNVERLIKSAGGIEAVIYSSSCPQDIRNSFAHLSKKANFQITEFGSDSSRLGEVCGKPFNILMVGIKAKEKPAPKKQ